MNNSIIKKRFFTFLLLYLIVFTAYFTIITFSKYTGIISGGDSAVIAKWDVYTDTSDNESDIVDVINGNGGNTYIIKVTSLSETIASYSIVLSNLPSDLEVKLDNGEFNTPDEFNVITFEDVGEINANAEIKTITHTLTFSIPINSETTGLNEIDIDVIFVQKEIE